MNHILHLQVTCVNYEIFLFLKESFESDVTCIKYKIFTKSEEERAMRANDIPHMLDKLQLIEVAMLKGSYI